MPLHGTTFNAGDAELAEPRGAPLPAFASLPPSREALRLAQSAEAAAGLEDIRLKGGRDLCRAFCVDVVVRFRVRTAWVRFPPSSVHMPNALRHGPAFM